LHNFSKTNHFMWVFVLRDQKMKSRKDNNWKLYSKQTLYLLVQ